MKHRIESVVWTLSVGKFFYFVHEMQADKNRSCYAVMSPFDTLCHDVMYCMLNSFDR